MVFPAVKQCCYQGFTVKAKAKAMDLAVKAKAKDLTVKAKAKAKDLGVKAKAKAKDLTVKAKTKAKDLAVKTTSNDVIKLYNRTHTHMQMMPICISFAGKIAVYINRTL